MKFCRFAVVLAAWVYGAFATVAGASTITYNFQMDAPNGYPVTHLVLYAAGAGQDDVYLSPVVLPPSGIFQLTQSVGFAATSALVMGITERDKDAWWDIIMFTNNAYAAAAVGQRYDALFPSATNLTHNVVTPVMQDAHAGDADALAALTVYLRGASAAAAYFDPYGSYSIIQFSVVEPPIGRDTPEPASLALLGLGALPLAFGRRRRGC